MDVTSNVVRSRGVVDVLIVDDDVDLRATLAELLSEWGFAVEAVENGRAALLAIEQGLQPRMVLLDLEMPVMDGRAFLDACHSHPALADVRVVVLSAAADLSPARDRQVSATVRKPVAAERLLQIVRRISSAARARAA